MTAKDFEAVAANYATTASKTLGEVLAEYPLAQYSNPFQAASAVVTDAAFACPALISDVIIATHTGWHEPKNYMRAEAPVVFAYEFDEDKDSTFASGHYADVGYLFNSSNAETLLGESMRHHWAQFARTGNPNAKKSAEWKPFTLRKRYVRLLAPAARGQDYAGEHRCAFWGIKSGIPENSRN